MVLSPQQPSLRTGKCVLPHQLELSRLSLPI